MAFEKLYFDCDKNSSKLIQDIINIILDNNNDLESIFECSGIKNIHYQKISKLFINAIKTNDYPLSQYTPKRLSIAMKRYLENRSKKDLFEELLARFYYDSCLEGKRIEMDFPPLFDETAFVQYNPWEKIYSLPENDITKPCQQPFFRFFAWFDGSFNCCDMDYKSELSKNSQKISSEYTIEDAWNSEIMKSIRHLHHTGQRNSLEPCKRCPIEPSK